MIAEVKFKEVGKEHIGKTSYIAPNITRKEVIDWFGLNNPDIECYDVKITNEID